MPSRSQPPDGSEVIGQPARERQRVTVPIRLLIGNELAERARRIWGRRTAWLNVKAGNAPGRPHIFRTPVRHAPRSRHTAGPLTIRSSLDLLGYRERWLL